MKSKKLDKQRVYKSNTEREVAAVSRVIRSMELVVSIPHPARSQSQVVFSWHLARLFRDETWAPQHCKNHLDVSSDVMLTCTQLTTLHHNTLCRLGLLIYCSRERFMLCDGYQTIIAIVLIH